MNFRIDFIIQLLHHHTSALHFPCPSSPVTLFLLGLFIAPFTSSLLKSFLPLLPLILFSHPALSFVYPRPTFLLFPYLSRLISSFSLLISLPPTYPFPSAFNRSTFSHTLVFFYYASLCQSLLSSIFLQSSLFSL